MIYVLYISVGSKVVSRYSRPLLPLWDAEGFLLFQMDTTSARRFTAKRKAVLINVLSESFCT